MTEEKSFENLRRYLENPETRRDARPRIISVIFEGASPEIEKLNSQLDSVEGNEGIEVFSDLMRLYSSCDEHDQLMISIFGQQDFETMRNKRVRIATLNEPRDQFRLWYGFPNSFRGYHADSMGQGLVVGVYDHPEFVTRCSQSIFPESSSYKVDIPNGFTLFIPR